MKLDTFQVDDEDTGNNFFPKELVNFIPWGPHFPSKALLCNATEGCVGYLEYTEDCSKYNQAGINDVKVLKKVVHAYENVANLNRCIVKLYNKYMNARPTGDKCTEDFYLRPLAEPKGNVWYSCQPTGRYKLSSVVADMAEHMKFAGKITNHFLRATSASKLYHVNCEEQMVMEHTGHRSDSVREYRCTSDDQMYQCSEILYGNSDSLINTERKVFGDQTNVKCPFEGEGSLASLESKPKKLSTEGVKCQSINSGKQVSLAGTGDKCMSLNFTVNITY